MTRRTRSRFLFLSVLGVLVAVGIGTAYRALVDHWKGDVREPIIAAAFGGITFVILTLSALSWADRRKEWNGREPRN